MKTMSSLIIDENIQCLRENLKKHCLESLYESYTKIYNEKKEKIEDIIKLNNIYKYVFLPSGFSIWIIKGNTNDHLVFPNQFCSCPDFKFRVLIKKDVSCCYHMVAQSIGSQLKKFKIIYKKDSAFKEYISDFI
ncbi:MAG: hypothetical protein ACTSYF_00055 [Promethearchaeota archaeon]